MVIAAVTGGTGFIGRELVQKLLASGYKVRVLTRKVSIPATDNANLTYFYGDILTANLDQFLDGVDTLFNCAGEILDESRMEPLHVKGTKRLIDAARSRTRRWVHLSSTGAYGIRREGTVIETDPLNPIGVYEQTKAISDQLVINAGEIGSFEYVVLRPSVVFGADMPNQSLFALIRMIQKCIFFFVGSTSSSANYIHVKNVAYALQLCAEKPEARNQIFNLSDHATLKEFVSTISLAMNVPVPCVVLPEPIVRFIVKIFSFIPSWPLTQSRVDALTIRVKFPIDKIERMLNYKNVFSLKESIDDLVHGYKCRERK